MGRYHQKRINVFKCAVLSMCIFLSATPLFAAENNEVVTSDGTAIRPQAWSRDSFPLRWYLSSSGIVNNDARGAGTLGISNSAAIEEVDRGIQTWADVANAGISIISDDENPNTASISSTSRPGPTIREYSPLPSRCAP